MANVILLSTFNRKITATRAIPCYALASWLRKNGYTVEVIEYCHVYNEQILTKLVEHFIDDETYVIGLSTTFWFDSFYLTDHKKFNYTIDRVRKNLQQKYPKIKYAVGGANTVAHVGWKSFYGEAEDSFLNWIDTLSNRKMTREKFDFLKHQNIFQPSDFIRNNEALPLDFSRGCKFKCRFCAYPNIGKKPGTYIRPINDIKEEILYNWENFGTTKYFMTSDTTNEETEFVENFADMVQSLPFKLEWVGFLRADLIYSQPHTAQLLKDSGLVSCFFGIETFGKESAKAVGKGWSHKHAKDWLPVLRHEIWKNIPIQCGFIIGLPGDTYEDQLDVVRWANDKKIDHINFNCLTLDQTASFKSEFVLNADKWGYKFTSPSNWYNNIMSLNDAIKIETEILKITSVINKVAGWSVFYLNNADFKPEETINVRMKDIDWNRAKSTSEKIFHDYMINKIEQTP